MFLQLWAHVLFIFTPSLSFAILTKSQFAVNYDRESTVAGLHWLNVPLCTVYPNFMIGTRRLPVVISAKANGL